MELTANGSEEECSNWTEEDEEYICPSCPGSPELEDEEEMDEEQQILREGSF